MKENMQEKMGEKKQSMRHLRSQMSKKEVHRKILKSLTVNFTKSFQHLMFQKTKSTKLWIIIPLITTIAESPSNLSSLNYLDRLHLFSLSIFLGLVRERICLILMSSRSRRKMSCKDLSKDKEALNHPSRCPFQHLHLFSFFFLFTVFSVF